MAERYKLPDGSERENGQRYDVIGVGITLIGFTIDGAVQWFPESMLTPVKPPTPEEPEPGAYDIGGRLCVWFRGHTTPMHWRWADPDDADGWGFGAWADLWEAIGGPDVTITRLVPEPRRYVAEVQLPWEGMTGSGGHVSVTRDDAGGYAAWVKLANTKSFILNSLYAREMASALLVAAEDADAASRAES